MTLCQTQPETQSYSLFPADFPRYLFFRSLILFVSNFVIVCCKVFILLGFHIPMLGFKIYFIPNNFFVVGTLFRLTISLAWLYRMLKITYQYSKYWYFLFLERHLNVDVCQSPSRWLCCGPSNFNLIFIIVLQIHELGYTILKSTPRFC